MFSKILTLFSEKVKSSPPGNCIRELERIYKEPHKPSLPKTACAVFIKFAPLSCSLLIAILSAVYQSGKEAR
jgi:hypothetical protein